MAAAGVNMRFPRRFCTLVRFLSAKYVSPTTRRSISASLMVSAALMKLSCENKLKLEEPDPTTLSREYLIKSASISTAEQAGILLTQTALALKEAEKEYVEAIFAVVILMEYKLKVLGNTAEEARIGDLIVQARSLVHTKKTKKHDLEMILTSAKNLVNVAAEAAYMTGADLAGSCAGERLYKVEQFLKPGQRESEDAEIKLREAEVKTVNVEGKYAEELERRRAKALEHEVAMATMEDDDTTTNENNMQGQENDENDKDKSEQTDDSSQADDSEELQLDKKDILNMYLI